MTAPLCLTSSSSLSLSLGGAFCFTLFFGVEAREGVLFLLGVLFLAPVLEVVFQAGDFLATAFLLEAVLLVDTVFPLALLVVLLRVTVFVPLFFPQAFM